MPVHCKSPIVISLLLLLVSTLHSDCPLAAEQPDERQSGDERYSYRQEHDPNGIGKFYQGREIARVMGYAGAGWLERSSREREERLSLLVRSLELTPGMSVADIGAGSGVISVMLAEAVGSDGMVYAVDVQQEMINLLKKKLRDNKIENITPVLGTSRSPRLKPNTLDWAVMVDVYHEFEFPYEMLLEISRALKPGGKIAFVEYRMEDPAVPIKRVHKMSEAQVKREAGQSAFGLEFVKTIGVLPRQHIVVFKRVAP